MIDYTFSQIRGNKASNLNFFSNIRQLVDNDIKSLRLGKVGYAPNDIDISVLDDTIQQVYNADQTMLRIEYQHDELTFSNENGLLYYGIYLHEDSGHHKVTEFLRKEILKLTSLRANIILPGELPTVTSKRVIKDFGFTGKIYGVAISWLLLLHCGKNERHSFSKEQLLNAPCYRVTDVDENSVLIQLTKDFKSNEFDEEYYQAYKNLHEYFLSLKNS